MKSENSVRNDLENKEKHDDIRLIHNGTRTTLKSEINRKIQSYQKKEVIDCLQHDIMILEKEDINDNIKNLVENVFRNSDINWNLLSLGGQKFLDEKPEVLRIVKPLKIIAAAKKTGLIERKLWFDLIGSGLVILFCLLVCGILMLFYDGNLKEISIVCRIPEILQNKSFLISWGISSFSGLLIYKFIKEKLLTNNAGLLKKILDRTGRGNSYDTTSNDFFSYIRDEILQMQMPAAIVVKGTEFLDSFTRRILNELLTIEKHQSSGLIFWVIIDQEKPDTENELITLIKKNSKVSGYSYHIYRFESYF